METPHELGPEHAGFRADHQTFTVGLLGLGVSVLALGGVMAYFIKKNEEDHGYLQKQLDALFDVEEKEHGRKLRPATAAVSAIFAPNEEASKFHIGKSDVMIVRSLNTPWSKVQDILDKNLSAPLYQLKILLARVGARFRDKAEEQRWEQVAAYV